MLFRLERSWNASYDSTRLTFHDYNHRSKLTLGDYNHLVYNVHLPRLAANGHNFHIQQPGIKISSPIANSQSPIAICHMNKVMQGGEILYCLDDGEWQTYTAPIEVPNGTQIIQAKVLYLGQESNTTWLWVNDQIEIDTNIQEQNTGATF